MKINNQLFYKENEPFFYLADTVWSAFTNTKMDDWEYYLDYRSNQGFNVVQINILPQWDRSTSEVDIIHPYKQTKEGYNFEIVNEDYFIHAEKMVKMAYDKGFTAALVLLWCSYVPETWASNAIKTTLMPKSAIEPYVEKVVSIFSKYDPIYIVSGDTDFDSENATDYYEIALNKVKTISPNCLTTLHVKGRLSDIPKRLEENPNLDFYFYQSGHNSEFQETSYTLAERFYEKEIKKPIINSEPCYEMMGYSRQKYGRFSRFDVRKSAWQSILSGASAGITYGAHGIWSWHEKGMNYGSALGEGFATPYNWRNALNFPGAWDYSFIKEFVVNNKLYNLIPKDIVLNDTKEIRAASKDGTLLLYVPSNIEVSLKGNWLRNKMTVIELETKRSAPLNVKIEKNTTVIKMHEFTGDCLYFFQ